MIADQTRNQSALLETLILAVSVKPLKVFRRENDRYFGTFPACPLHTRCGYYRTSAYISILLRTLFVGPDQEGLDPSGHASGVFELAFPDSENPPA